MWLRVLGYLWTAPNTCLALAVVAICLPFGIEAHLVDGVLEVHGRAIKNLLRKLPPRGMAVAVTLGHVVFGRSRQDLESSRSHERVHVRQYCRFGPFFLPAYFANSLWQWARGRDFYYENAFEQEAYGEG